ncbi:MAG: TRAP transporter substrate-binding protein DctP [Spirochaetia bacterium]|jgi:TRAP-type C4-dicarboxylate transport system substrate-binding protein|nr:TRAP transporter substrate-binding protein DctP [Spirochaetia bacterium]
MQIRRILLIFIFIFFTGTTVFSLTMKLGSLAPRNSPWDKTLNEIAAEWKTISGGKIQLKIYPGGITGNEDDTLRKLRVGALDGMIASTMGLNKISTDLFALSLPLLIHDEGELNFVMNKTYETFHKIMSDKGFELVGWTKAGWTNVFSRDPVYYPRDLESQKLGFTTGEVVFTQILKDLGFHIVPGDSIDWLTGLQSGRTDALLLSSLIAAAYQIFPIADNMLDFQLAPILGAIVFSERSWKKIPEEYRQDFLDVIKEKIITLDAEALALEKTALQVMLDNGLTVNAANNDVVAAWKDIVNDLYAKEGIIGSLVSRDIYNEIIFYTEEYRNN